MCAARTIGSSFEQISALYARSETGGLLNFIFDPVGNVTTGEVLLKPANLNVSLMVGYLKTIVFNATPSVRVLEVLPADVQPSHIEDNAYGVAVGLTMAAIVLAALSVMVLFVISIVYCCCVKRFIRGKKYDGPKHLSNVHSICYVCFAVLTVVMLAFLILCTIVGFIAVGSLVDGISSKTQDQNIPNGLAAAASTILIQTKLFLQDFILHGHNATAAVVSGLTEEIKADLATLVNDVLESLLTSYGVRDLMDQLHPLYSSIESLERIARLAANLQFDVIANITSLQQQVAVYRSSISESLQSLCKSLPQQPNECGTFTKQLEILDVRFNASRINTETSVALVDLVDTYGPNLSAVMKQFSNLDAEISSKALDLIDKVQDEVSLDEEFEKLLSVWDTLNSEVVEPTTSQIDNIQPAVDKAIELAALLFAVVGYVCMAIASIVLIIMLIYLVLCAIEAWQRGLISGRWTKPHQSAEDASDSRAEKIKQRGSKHKIFCGAATLAVFSIFLLIIVILSTVITTVLIVTNDEACRYLNKRSAMRVTDAALDLFLGYEWPILITDEIIPPEVQPLLELQPPKRILDALIHKCQPQSETDIVPLLPALGYNNLVNVTAILDQPALRSAVHEAEIKIVDEVSKVNFTSYIPQDIDELFETGKNMTRYLDNTDYKSSLEELTTTFINMSEATVYLEQVKAFASTYGSGQPSAETIKSTADSFLADLNEVESLIQKAKQLASYLEQLQQYQMLAPQLEAISATMHSIFQTLRNSTAVIGPLVSTYRNAITQLFAVFSYIMDVKMTQFTSQVASCSRLHLIIKSTLEITCGNTGLLNRLGGLTFILALLSFPLLLTAVLFQLLLGMHERLCLYANHHYG